jgi:hypothetical protein
MEETMKTALKVIAVLGLAAPVLAPSSFASDIGQKLQIQLQEANNIYTRAAKAKSNIKKKYDQTADATVQNIQG